MSGALRVAQMQGWRVVSWQARRQFGASAVLANPQPSDPIQKLYLDKIREYKTQAAGGKLPGFTAEVEKALAEDLERVKGAYGADKEDFTTFPSIKFEDKPIELY